MFRRFPIPLAAALLAFAQKDEPRKLRAYFLDGTGVEFEQEATVPRYWRCTAAAWR
jgi:hypothetical protein